MAKSRLPGVTTWLRKLAKVSLTPALLLQDVLFCQW